MLSFLKNLFQNIFFISHKIFLSKLFSHVFIDSTTKFINSLLLNYWFRERIDLNCNQYAIVIKKKDSPNRNTWESFSNALNAVFPFYSKKVFVNIWIIYLFMNLIYLEITIFFLLFWIRESNKYDILILFGWMIIFDIFWK